MLQIFLFSAMIPRRAGGKCITAKACSKQRRYSRMMVKTWCPNWVFVPQKNWEKKTPKNHQTTKATRGHGSPTPIRISWEFFVLVEIRLNSQELKALRKKSMERRTWWAVSILWQLCVTIRIGSSVVYFVPPTCFRAMNQVSRIPWCQNGSGEVPKVSLWVSNQANAIPRPNWPRHPNDNGQYA